MSPTNKTITQTLGLVVIPFVVLAALSRPAMAASTEISFNKAQDFSNALVLWRQNAHIAGRFDRNSKFDHDLGDTVQVLLDQSFGENTFRLEQIIAETENTQLVVTEVASGRSLSLGASRDQAPKASKSSADIKNSRGFLPITHLVIANTSSVHQNDGSFVSWTALPTSNRLDLGKSKGAFTLSVFGDVSVDSMNVGVSPSVRLRMNDGWSLTIAAEISESIPSDLIQGHMTSSGFDQLKGSLRVQIDRTWDLTGLHASVGTTLDLNSKLSVFVCLGRNFMDRQGRHIGSLDLIASSSVQGNQHDEMIAIQASFSF